MDEAMMAEWVRNLWERRYHGRSRPEGQKDGGSRWYPSDREDGDGYTNAIRSPTRRWPWSYWKAAHSRKHLAALCALAVNGDDVPEDVWQCCPARARFAPNTPIEIVRDYVMEGCPALS